MRVFVLTETDSSDTAWCYNEVFTDKEKAIERMKEFYKESVIDMEDLVVKAELNEMDANAEMNGGIIIAWNIKDCDIK